MVYNVVDHELPKLTALARSQCKRLRMRCVEVRWKRFIIRNIRPSKLWTRVINNNVICFAIRLNNIRPKNYDKHLSIRLPSTNTSRMKLV